jgi:hypothetical protein
MQVRRTTEMFVHPKTDFFSSPLGSRGASAVAQALAEESDGVAGRFERVGVFGPQWPDCVEKEVDEDFLILRQWIRAQWHRQLAI